MLLLGIETSCDETGIAVLEQTDGRFVVRSHFLASQVKEHAKYGGVVPEVAARLHLEVILPGLRAALAEAKITLNDLDVIAVTAGPGLMTSLLVGVETARSLAYALKKPLVAVNHLAGHLYANWLPAEDGTVLVPRQPFPSLGLLVSGGHTELVLMAGHGRFKLLGATRDDAAGEAFDKVGKLMGLGYPGGPLLSKLAERGDPNAIKIPRPMLASPDLDFSFAGIKTWVRYYIDRHRLDPKRKRDLAASFEQACVDVLVAKTLRALKRQRVKTLLLAGGVAANKKLRSQLGAAAETRFPDLRFLTPDLRYCTDNAAMIAAAGYFQAIQKESTPWKKLDVDPNWELGRRKSI